MSKFRGDWELKLDEKSGLRYYFNHQTRTSVWTLPENHEEFDGWTEHVDPKSRARYFYNVKTGKSSWTIPDGLFEERPQLQVQEYAGGKIALDEKKEESESEDDFSQQSAHGISWSVQETQETVSSIQFQNSLTSTEGTTTTNQQSLFNVAGSATYSTWCFATVPDQTVQIWASCTLTCTNEVIQLFSGASLMTEVAVSSIKDFELLDGAGLSLMIKIALKETDTANLKAHNFSMVLPQTFQAVLWIASTVQTLFPNKNIPYYLFEGAVTPQHLTLQHWLCQQTHTTQVLVRPERAKNWRPCRLALQKGSLQFFQKNTSKDPIWSFPIKGISLELGASHPSSPYTFNLKHDKGSKPALCICCETLEDMGTWWALLLGTSLNEDQACECLSVMINEVGSREMLSPSTLKKAEVHSLVEMDFLSEDQNTGRFMVISPNPFGVQGDSLVVSINGFQVAHLPQGDALEVVRSTPLPVCLELAEPPSFTYDNCLIQYTKKDPNSESIPGPQADQWARSRVNVTQGVLTFKPKGAKSQQFQLMNSWIAIQAPLPSSSIDLPHICLIEQKGETATPEEQGVCFLQPTSFEQLLEWGVSFVESAVFGELHSEDMCIGWGNSTQQLDVQFSSRPSLTEETLSKVTGAGLMDAVSKVKGRIKNFGYDVSNFNAESYSAKGLDDLCQHLKALSLEVNLNLAKTRQIHQKPGVSSGFISLTPITIFLPRLESEIFVDVLCNTELDINVCWDTLKLQGKTKQIGSNQRLVVYAAIADELVRNPRLLAAIGDCVPAQARRRLAWISIHTLFARYSRDVACLQTFLKAASAYVPKDKEPTDGQTVPNRSWQLPQCFFKDLCNALCWDTEVLAYADRVIQNALDHWEQSHQYMGSDEENDLAGLGAGLSLAMQVGRSVVSFWVEAVPGALKEALILVSQSCEVYDHGADNSIGRKAAAQILLDHLLMPILMKKIHNQNIHRTCHQQQAPPIDIFSNIGQWAHICLQTIFMEVYDKTLSIKERARLANHQFQVQMFLNALCLPKAEDNMLCNKIPGWLENCHDFIVSSFSELDFLHLCFTHYLQMAEEDRVPSKKDVCNLVKSLSPPDSHQNQLEENNIPFVLHLKFGIEEKTDYGDCNEDQRKLSEFHWLIRCAQFHIKKALALRESQINTATDDEEVFSEYDDMASKVARALCALHEELKKKSKELKQTLNREKTLKSTGIFSQGFLKELNLSTQLVDDENTAQMMMKGKQISEVCAEGGALRQEYKAALLFSSSKSKAHEKRNKENLILATMLSSNPLSDLLRTTFSTSQPSLQYVH